MVFFFNPNYPVKNPFIRNWIDRFIIKVYFFFLLLKRVCVFRIFLELKFRFIKKKRNPSGGAIGRHPCLHPMIKPLKSLQCRLAARVFVIVWKFVSNREIVVVMASRPINYHRSCQPGSVKRQIRRILMMDHPLRPRKKESRIRSWWTPKIQCRYTQRY